MSTKWLIGLLLMWGVMTLISGVLESTTLGENEVGILQGLMTSPTVTSSTDFLGAATSWINYGTNFIGNLWDVFWFNYSFFQGQWLIVKYVIFMPISVALAFSIGLAIVRGVGSD